MQKSRTINLHLVTGNPLGGKIISFSNRTILWVAFSRKDFDTMKNRSELTRSGVYFLIGENEKSEPTAYIWQATILANRIKDHYNNTVKDFWNHAVVFTTTDNSFTEADINFLEKELIQIGINAGRYEMENWTKGNRSLVHEFRISDLHEYIEDLKILLSSLGFQVLQERITKQDERKKYFLNFKWLKASGYYTQEGFLVLKWSEWPWEKQKHVIMWKGYAFRNRPILIDEEIIKELDDKIVFLKDHLFKSPTASAELISGWSINGWDYWKTQDGKTLKEIEWRNT